MITSASPLTTIINPIFSRQYTRRASPVRSIDLEKKSLTPASTSHRDTKYVHIVRSTNNGSLIFEEEEEDVDLCPVDCVTEFKTEEEFQKLLEKAKERGALAIVDFYRTSCGSCKYIEQGFIKMCKGSRDQETDVVFLKHNVIDEYDEQSEVADRLRIKVVPLFHFYKDGVLLEAFPTRDKEKILDAIRRYTSNE
ncbi:hypothetical protein LUZ60_017609 [Juncus effusus]|nr:hypothetical protein LUZ60_017609 [Juncus effusus]